MAAIPMGSQQFLPKSDLVNDAVYPRSILAIPFDFGLLGEQMIPVWIRRK
jgi:hypothetical protein